MRTHSAYISFCLVFTQPTIIITTFTLPPLLHDEVHADTGHATPDPGRCV